MQKYDIAIIGGGILGTTISYWLSTLYDLKICVIEKEHDVALHSSTRNSGVIHYPFYLNPKQKKNFARAAFLSHDMWKVLAHEKNIPWIQGGTIEIAPAFCYVKAPGERFELSFPCENALYG